MMRYGCQDLKDDLNAGVKFTATLYAGQKIKPLLGFFGFIVMACIFAAELAEGAGKAYFVGAEGGGSVLFVRELLEVNLREPGPV